MRLCIGGALVLALAGCPGEGEGDEESTSAPPSTTTPPSSTTASSGTTGDPPQTESESESESSPETESGSSDTNEESTGEEGCPEALLPAEVTEVEGCGDPIGEPYCSEGQGHVEDGSEVEWESNPPHSGTHYQTWENWGEHNETVPRGHWVHNMEHGGIVLAYLCPGDNCPDELDILRQVIEERPDARILMTSDPELPGEGFAAVSWTWVHMFDAPDLDELLCFVDQHFNHAPEDVP